MSSAVGKRSPLKERCVGRWKSILPMIGISTSYLRDVHGPCPMCGGKDRWRFDDKGGNGTWYCSHCGAGDGTELVKLFLKVEFKEAAVEIEKHLPDSAVVVPKAERSEAEKQDRALRQWRRGLPLNGICPASRYLIRRGISMERWPSQLRFLPEARFWKEDHTYSVHPAMIAQFVAADMSATTVHITYLTEDGEKAKLPETRKLMPGRIPKGGAVRLAPSGPVMGVAEGIETALSASRIWSIPVWACLNAGLLLKWEPPLTARKVLIFGDRDSSFAGQHVTYGLAYRLKTKGLEVEPLMPDEMDVDWNDILCASSAESADAGQQVCDSSGPLHL